MKKIKYTALVAAVFALSVSCTHNFDKYNDDPNRLTIWEVGPDDLMEEILFEGTNGFVTRGFSITGELIQYTATGSGSTAVHRYFMNAGTVASAWDHLAKWAVNADHMYELAVLSGSRNYQAVALTLRALYVSNLTDVYGDIPFSEGFTMYTENPIEKPVFDEQKDVYIQLLEDLELANSLYSTSGSFDAGYRDLIYGGEIAQWKKFTNSLYLRLLMRLSNRDEELNVSAKIAEIFSSPYVYPVFEGLDDSAIISYTGQTPNIHPYGNTTSNSWNGRRAAHYMIDLLENTRDPRLSLYYTMRGSDWEGNPSGMALQDMAGIDAANLNKDNLGMENSPYAIMKYDEVLFIKLEAMYRGWIPGDRIAAEELWKDAFAASIEYWNWINTALKLEEEHVNELYFSRNPYEHSLEFIMTQKYIALFWTGYEAWHEWRRTEYPVLPIGTHTHNDRILPRRFEYPINSRETNRDNYDAVVSRYAAKYRNGGDNMKTPVWWSKAAIENER